MREEPSPEDTPTSSRPPRRINWRVAVPFLALALAVSAVLFIAAGTLDWPMAWIYVAISLGFQFGSRIVLLRLNPGLAAERSHSLAANDAKEWDKTLMPIVAIYGPLLSMILAGLNRRFGWPPEVPLAVQVTGLLVVVLGGAFSTWAMLSNRFFSATVRIQRDRGHAVFTGGPYRFVRHPGYLGGIVANLVTPLALGSLWALVPGALTAGLTVLRTALEDRVLLAELPGYPEYAGRTRYRLIPGVW